MTNFDFGIEKVGLPSPQRQGRRGLARTEEWLCLAAAPAFLLMGLAALPHGMAPMYLLMGIFHLPPWLKFFGGRAGS